MLAQAFHDPKSLGGPLEALDEDVQSHATLGKWVQAARDRKQRRKLLELQRQQQQQQK